MSEARRPRLIVRPRGRIGNLMFQWMLAIRINERLGGAATIHGIEIPEWAITSLPVGEPPRRALRLTGHLFDLDEVAYCLRSGICDAVIIEGWGQRLEYFPDPAPIRRLFRSGEPPHAIGDHELLINIRAEDIETGNAPGYYPLPFAFYEAVLDTEGLAPVFLGQLQPSPYTDALRARFPGARFLPVTSALKDFQTIRNAANVVLSISSFAWLAGWLSESARAVHLPVAGLFDPRRGRQNLLALDGPRWRYWDVEFPSMEQRQGLRAESWASGARRVEAKDLAWARDVGSAGLSMRVPRATHSSGPHRS